MSKNTESGEITKYLEGYPRFTENFPGVLKPAKKAIENLDDLISGNFPDQGFLERYKPKPEWFLFQYDGLHGAGHIGRVIILQEVLSRLLVTQGAHLDREALRWAAASHDLGRVEDGIDVGHGTRSAEWIGKNLQGVLEPISLDTAIYIVTWHVPNDWHAPEMTPELAVLKDADGLDRVRLGDLNPRFLRHLLSRILLPTIAEELFLLSTVKQLQQRIDPYDSAISAGIDLGIISS